MITFSPNQVAASADVDANFTGLSDGTLDTTANSLVQARADAHANYVVSGLVISNLGSSAVGITSGVVEINGKRLTVSAVATHTLGGPLDWYVYVQDNGDGTGIVGYTSTTTNTTSPSLPANSLWIGIVNASNVAVIEINQGNTDATRPVVSSCTLLISDTRGNLICNRSPRPRLIGLRKITSNVGLTAGGTETDITGLALTVITPTYRNKLKVKASAGISNSGSGSKTLLNIKDSGTTYYQRGWFYKVDTTDFILQAETPAMTFTGGSSQAFKLSAAASGGTDTVSCSATQPAFIEVTVAD